MKFPTTPKDWIKFLAENNAMLVKRTDSVTGKQSVIIRRQQKGLGRHLFGEKTREYVIDELLKKYGSVEAVNSEIRRH